MSNKLEIVNVPISMNTTRVVDVEGVQAATTLGPARFPRALRIELRDSPRPICTVDFLYYIDPEEETSELTQPNGRVLYGRFSGRIMRFEINLTGASPSNARVKVEAVTTMTKLADALQIKTRSSDPISKPPSQDVYFETLKEMMPWVSGQLDKLRDRPSCP